MGVEGGERLAHREEDDEEAASSQVSATALKVLRSSGGEIARFLRERSNP